MITGQIWLRVPETIRIVLRGERPRDLTAKDLALAIVARLGAEGANYQAVEFDGEGVAEFALDDRLVSEQPAGRDRRQGRDVGRG